MSNSTLVVTLPERLRSEVERAAAAEHTTPEEWVRRAVARQLDDREWHGILTYGAQRAAALGHTEDDVERLIAESRRERHTAAPQDERTPGP